MKIFAPRRHYNAAPDNPIIMNWTYAEIGESDLRRVVDERELLGSPSPLRYPTDSAQAREYFHARAKDVCEELYRKEQLWPFLLNPWFVVHSGAKKGHPDFEKLFYDVAYETGRLVAHSGFSIWNGGGTGGPMGATIQGFNDGIAEIGGPQPGQCSIQVLPGQFVFPQNKNEQPGIGIVNEGLSHVTDAAIIAPTFEHRRALLDTLAAGAISCPGGSGTLDEITDVGVHAKTGLRDVPLCIINTLMPDLGMRYYDHFKHHIEFTINVGLESPTSRNIFQFAESPEQAIQNILQRLAAAGKTREQLYRKNCELFGVAVPPANVIPMRPVMAGQTHSNAIPGNGLQHLTAG